MIVRADANADNLAGLTMKKHWKAKSGEAGMGAKCAGKNAKILCSSCRPAPSSATANAATC